MNMAINVHECGRGGKCVYMFRYTYAGILRNEDADGKKERRVKRVMRTSIGTVTEVSTKFVQKEVPGFLPFFLSFLGFKDPT